MTMRGGGFKFTKCIEPSGQAFSPSGMKEGWSVPSRGANFSLIGERGRSTPAIFRRSLSPHSLRDVSKPRGHSTQPLLLQHVQDCIQAPALSPHSKGDIRTAPPSRSRVTDYKHNNRNAVKRNSFSLRQNSSWPCLTRPSFFNERFAGQARE